MTITDFQVGRVYYQGFKPDDHVVVKPNCSVLAPIQPPQNTGLIETTAKVRGTMALLYTVVATSDVQDDHEAIKVGVGDVVTVRLAHCDPIHPDEQQLIVPNRAIYSIVHRAPQRDAAQ